MNSTYTSAQSRREIWLHGDNYVRFIVLISSVGGLIQGYMEMMSYMLVRDANFVDYITTNKGRFCNNYILFYHGGAVFGALLSCRASDSLGRKTTLIYSCALIAGVISWTASSDTDLAVLTSRCTAGIAVGLMVTTAVNYVAELSPPHSRGSYCAVIPMMSLMGAATALTVSQITRQHTDSWRLCMAVPVMPALVMLLSLMFVPESPWWLLAHRSPADGLAALEKLRRQDEVSAEFNSMYRALSYDARQENTMKSLVYGDITLRYRLGLACLLQLVHALSCERLYYEFGDIIHKAADGGSLGWTFHIVSVAILFMVAIAGCISGCMYVDSVGRRDLLLLSLAGMGVTAFVCAWMIHIGHLDPLSAVPSDETGSAMQWSSESSFATYLTRYFYGGSILLYCYCSFMSIATCSVIIPVEMFPLRARSRALALSTACYYTIVIAFHYVGDVLSSIQSVHATGLIWTILAIASSAFGVYVFLAYPETNGIVFEDSDELFDIEEYDAGMWCCPKGSGSGYLGFRMLSHSGSRFHIYRNAATRGARLSPQLAGGRLALTSNRSRSGGTPQGSASSGSGKGGTSFFNTIFPPLTGHHTTSATQQSTVAGDVSSGYGTLEGGSLNNSLELSESTAAAFLIIDSHKYSEDMRCSDFQYVANEDMVTLHATPLFK